MKKELISGVLLLSSYAAYSQVGINNVDPKATLDITAKTTDGSKAEGLIPPRLTGDQIKAADAQYTAAQRGIIIYATAAVGTPSVKTANMTTEGYYYFDGSLWQKIGNTYTGSSSVALNGTSFERAALTGDITAAANSNTTTIANDAVNSAKIADGTVGNVDIASGSGGIYKGSGSLNGNTTVTQGSNTLAFTSTATNGFSVDGTTLSVDAANNRVGIGTATPTANLEVNSGVANTSGLKFTNFNSSTPVSSFARSIGVDANGNIVTIPSVQITGARVIASATSTIPSSPAIDITSTSMFSQQVIDGSELIVTIPPGYSNVRIVLRWDVWGSTNSTGNALGNLRFGIRQTGTSSNSLTSASMTGWSSSGGMSMRWSTPIAYTIDGLAPGTYSFKMAINREQEVNATVVVIWGLQGLAQVFGE